MISRVKMCVKRLLAKRNLKKISQRATVGNGIVASREAFVMAPSKEQICIGDNSEIACTLVCQDKGRITIGKNAWIGAKTVIGSIEEILIGDYVIISTDVHIYDNNNHPTSPELRQKMSESGFHSELWSWKHADSKRVLIGDRVWIGERSVILKGVTIGNDSIVAAGSVVTHDVPPSTIVAGNPARVVKQIKA